MSDGSRTAPVKLHEEVQRWIWSQGWDKLRPIQEQAIAPILSGNTNLIISAATAGGKSDGHLQLCLTQWPSILFELCDSL
jgi:replicative superfamily II helicase